MEKEFVTYEPSLALKELGFDEPCFRYYVDNKLIQNGLNILNTDCNWVDNQCSAPTYSQVFRWFKEKHNIRVWTEWGSEYLCCAMIQYSSGMKECIDCCSNDEEAEQACLDKLIEITKNK